MKILYILDFFYPSVGGVPTLFFNLTKEMAKNNDVTVVTSSSGSNKGFERIEGIDVHRFGRGRPSFLINTLLRSNSLKKKFDLVHTSTYSSIIPAYFYSSSKKIPRILTVHEAWPLKFWVEFLKLKGLFYFFEERLLLSFPFNKYTVPSNYTKKALEKVGISGERIEVIPHAIDGSVFQPSLRREELKKEFGFSPEDTVVTFVGRPGVSKGIDYLLKSIPTVKSSVGSTKFVFLTPKQPKDEFEKFMRKFSILKSHYPDISWLNGPGAEYAAKLMNSSDIMVVPSITEGFCFVAAEAKSVGLPLISTRGGSLPEILNKKDCLFVDERDHGQLAEAIIKLSDKGRREKLSNAKKFAGWAEISKKYEALYSSLIRG